MLEEQRGFTGKEQEGTFRNDGNHSLIVVIVTWCIHFVKTYQIVHQKSVFLTVCR